MKVGKAAKNRRACNVSDKNAIAELTQAAVDFRNQRNWAQFHTPKDLALDLMIEAAELAEHFLWKNETEQRTITAKKRREIGDELADVLYTVLVLGHDLDIDLAAALKAKLKKNARKYPVKKAYGRNVKYSEL